MNAISVKGLTRTFNGFNLGPIDLNLPLGYIMGYVGRNGAGKTTTIQAILGNIVADGGEIEIFGHEMNRSSRDMMDGIGIINDECYFPDNFKIKEIIRTLIDFYPSFDTNRFESWVKRWNLPINKKVKTFSRGMKTKLMFAAVLSRDTQILLLDEATSGLDPVVRTEILEILQEYISDGQRSVLLSSHVISDIEKVADFITFIDNGQIVFSEKTDDLKEGYLMMKGQKSLLGLKENFIGYKESLYGIEGLIRKTDQNLFSGQGQVIFEKPTMDELVVNYIRGMKGAE
jgi:ABC-2 type transport system ATP-binding protein